MVALVEKSIGNLQDAEFGASVQRVAHLLLFLFWQGCDELFRQHVALVQIIVFLCQLARDGLGLLFSVPHRAQAVCGDAVFYQVVHYALSTPLTQLLVVFVITAIVAMARKLNGHIGILVEEVHQAVQCQRAAFGEFRTVELIEHIADKYRSGDGRQGKLKRVFLAHAAGVHIQFLLMVQVSLAGSQEDVAYAWFHVLGERAVALEGQFQVGSIVAHHIDESFGQFIAILLVNPSRHGIRDFRTLEGHDVVPSAGIASARAEVAAIVHSLEGHAEIVAAAVHRVFQVGDVPGLFLLRAVQLCAEEVQSSHSWMAVAAEVKISVGTEGGEHLVAFRVDGSAHVFHAAQCAVGQRDAPDVQPSQSARHIADEIEPVSIGADSRVGIAREGILADGEQRRLAPRGIASLAGVYLGIARVVGVVGAAGQIHRFPVGAETDGSFVVLAVQFALHALHGHPFPLVVLLGEEDVGSFGSCDAADLVARSLGACAAQEELVGFLAQQDRAVVGSSAVQVGFLLHRVECGVLFPGRSQLTSFLSVDCQLVGGVDFQEGLVVLDGVLVVALPLLHLSQVEKGHIVGILVSDGVLIGSHRLGAIVHLPVAFSHLPSPFAPLRFLFGGSASVAFLVLGCCVVVFSDGVESVALLDVILCAA